MPLTLCCAAVCDETNRLRYHFQETAEKVFVGAESGFVSSLAIRANTNNHSRCSSNGDEDNGFYTFFCCEGSGLNNRNKSFHVEISYDVLEILTRVSHLIVAAPSLLT